VAEVGRLLLELVPKTPWDLEYGLWDYVPLEAPNLQAVGEPEVVQIEAF
jgi:hypothetical protein